MQKKKVRTKAAIYCRLSEEDRNKQFESDDSNSIQNQKAMLMQYAMEQGWDVYNIYSDGYATIGKSGENLVKSRASALVPFSFLLRDKPKSFKSLKIINERL